MNISDIDTALAELQNKLVAMDKELTNMIAAIHKITKKGN